MAWFITRHKEKTNYVLSVAVVFPVLGMPDKLHKFPGKWIGFSVIKSY